MRYLPLIVTKAPSSAGEITPPLRSIERSGLLFALLNAVSSLTAPSITRRGGRAAECVAPTFRPEVCLRGGKALVVTSRVRKTGVYPPKSGQIEAEAIEAYDRIIGLDLRVVAADGSIHKAPCGGEATGKSPVDRAKLGWKWSIAVDANGIPIGTALGGANTNDLKLLEPMLDSLSRIGLDRDIELLCLDRGYDYPKTRRLLNQRGYTELDIQQRGMCQSSQVGGHFRATLNPRYERSGRASSSDLKRCGVGSVSC